MFRSRLVRITKGRVQVQPGAGPRDSGSRPAERLPCPLLDGPRRGVRAAAAPTDRPVHWVHPSRAPLPIPHPGAGVGCVPPPRAPTGRRLSPGGAADGQEQQSHLGLGALWGGGASERPTKRFRGSDPALKGAHTVAR